MTTQLKRKSCIRYKKGTSPLSDNAENELLNQVDLWTIDRSGVHRLEKKFAFNSFSEAMGFTNTLAIIADEEQHHPSIHIDYRTVSIELTTHVLRGLSENDFIMAAKIDGIYSLVSEPVNGVLESAML